MKNTKFLNLLLAACSLVSCSDKGILDPDLPSVDGKTVKIREDKNLKFKGHPLHSRFIITGDTTLAFNSFHRTRKEGRVNLAHIENAQRKGQPFRLVVFGGSLGAGVRDGGLFNEGMETSFGSLLANQMGVNFKNPLFDPEDFNGFGRLALTGFNPTGGPIPKFKNVSNNTGVVTGTSEANGNVVLKKTSVEYDNYSFPYGSFVSEGESALYIKGIHELMSPFAKRLNNPNLTAEIKAGKTFDFFILEIPERDQNFLGTGAEGTLEDIRKYFENLPEFDNLNPPYLGPAVGAPVGMNYFNFFKKMQRVGSKGIILNLPHIYDLPFYNQNYKNQLAKTLEIHQISKLNWVGGPSEMKIRTEPLYGSILRADIIFGYSGLDSLISNKVNFNLRPGIGRNQPVILGFHNDIDVEGMKSVRREYAKTFKVGQALGYPVVDLFTLYESIAAGNYVTHDGIKVNGDWPRGNFFSYDGIHPSAFGQAVITNEIIRTMNSYFQLEIPYVSTREYLNK